MRNGITYSIITFVIMVLTSPNFANADAQSQPAMDEKTALAIGNEILAVLSKFAAGHPKIQLPALTDKPVFILHKDKGPAVQLSKDLEPFFITPDSATSGGYPIMEGYRWFIQLSRNAKGEWEVKECGRFFENNK